MSIKATADGFLSLKSLRSNQIGSGSGSGSGSFLMPNGINDLHTDSQLQQNNNTDIVEFEMAAVQPPPHTYTSLKDLLPVTPQPLIFTRRDSWREIPIKNPLLQHAAWAYLWPKSSTPRVADQDRSCCFERWKDRCVGLFGWFGGFLFGETMVNGWSSVSLESEFGDCYDDSPKVD